MARGTAISLWVVGSVWAIVILLLVLPYRNPLLGYSVFIIPLMILAVFWAVFCLRKRRTLSQYLVSGAIFAGCIAGYFLVTVVTFRDDLIAPEVAGRVCSVTRSENHRYPEVQIQQADGCIATLTGVSEDFFGSVRVGDLVHKSAGAVGIVMGDHRMDIVDRSMVDVVRLRSAGTE